jgi:hypothetical protein
MNNFKKNKVSIFKSAKHRVIKTNNPNIGLFCAPKVEDIVNNKGMGKHSVRYNPDVLVIPVHDSKNLYMGR